MNLHKNKEESIYQPLFLLLLTRPHVQCFQHVVWVLQFLICSLCHIYKDLFEYESWKSLCYNVFLEK
jgi:hypothetical protein